MEKVEKKIDEQLQFWSVIGPFMTLLTLMVCLTKGSGAQGAFAVIGLIGIPLCLRWKKQGMLFSLVLLAAVFLYQMPALALDQQLWSGGIFLSFALSFFVTALSFEESSHIVSGIVADSNSRLHQMLALDDKVKGIESELEEERNSWTAKCSAAEAEALFYKEKFNTTQTLVDAAQQELTTIYDRNKGLLEELFEMKSKAAVAVPPVELQIVREKLQKEEERSLMLELVLEEKELARQKEVEVHKKAYEEARQEVQKAVEEGNTRVATLTQEMESIRDQMSFYKTSQEQQQQLLSEKEMALEQLTQALAQLREEKEALLKQKQEKVTTTSAKKETAAYRKLQGMYKQLKEQFEEKCDILDETRRAQFHMQERLFNAQRELEEKQRTEKSEVEAAFEQHLLKMEEERTRLEKEYHDEIEALNQIIASLSLVSAIPT